MEDHATDQAASKLFVMARYVIATEASPQIKLPTYCLLRRWFGVPAGRARLATAQNRTEAPAGCRALLAT